MAQLTLEQLTTKYDDLFGDNALQHAGPETLREFRDDVRDTFALKADASTSPVPPAVNFDPVTRQLTATHPLGADQLEFTHNNAGFTAYAELQVDDAAHAQAEWRYRVKGATGRNPSQLTDSPEIKVKATTGAAGPFSITASQIRDASPAGKAVLLAPTTDDQLAMLDHLHLVDYPTLVRVYGEYGAVKYLLDRVKALTQTVGGIENPAKPTAFTNGHVDDAADTFAGMSSVVGLALGDCEIFYPGSSGNQLATNGRADWQDGVLTIRGLSGPIEVDGVGMRVAASGNRPASDWLTNKKAFTGTVAPVSTKATAPVFGTIDDTNNTVPLNSNYAYTEVRWGIESQAAQNLGSNSICSPGNIAGRLYAYVIADGATNRLQSDTVYSAAFSLAATANNAPTATISVVGGNSGVVTGQSVTLQLDGFDTDAGDSVVKLELLDNGVKIAGAEIASNSGMIQSPALTAGTHSFTARATDTKGTTGLSTAVVVSATAATPGITYGPTITSPNDYTHTPAGADLNYNGNGVDEYQSTDGVHRFLPFSEIDYETDSPSVTFYQKSTGSSLTASYYANGNLVTTFYGNTDTPAKLIVINSPVAAGQKWRVMGRNGSQDRDNEQGDIKVTQILTATFKGGSSTRVVKVTKSELLYLVSNSIDNGARCEANRLYADNDRTTVSREKNGYAMLLRTASRAVVVDGYGSHQAWVAFANDTEIQKVVDRYTASRIPNGRNTFGIPEVANAFYFASASQTAAMFAALIGKVYDKVHGLYPTDNFVLPTAIYRNDGVGGNNANETLQNYRDAATALGTSRSWLKVVPGLTLVSKTYIDKDASVPGKRDGLHPDEDGHKQLAQSWENILAGASAGVADNTSTGSGGGTTTPTNPGTGTTTPPATTGTVWRTASPPNGSEIVVTTDTPGRPNKAGQVSGWNSCVYGLDRVKQPAVGLTGEIARFTLPFPTDDLNGPMALGYTAEQETTVLESAATGTANSDARTPIIHGAYHSGQVLSQIGATAGYDTFNAADGDISFVVIADGNGGAKINSYQANRSAAIRDDRTVAAWPLYLRGVLNTGNGSSIPKIIGVTHTGSHLERY